MKYKSIPQLQPLFSSVFRVIVNRVCLSHYWRLSSQGKDGWDPIKPFTDQLKGPEDMSLL